MEGYVLERILLSCEVTKMGYGGIYNISTMPVDIPTGKYIVCNTTSNVNIIGHWVSYYKTRRNELIWIDSFGKSPSYYGGKLEDAFSIHHGNKSLLVKHQLQNKSSLTCGAYIIYMIYFLMKRYTNREILETFSRNTISNDNKVEKFVYKLSGTRLKCSSKLCPNITFNNRCYRENCVCMKIKK